MKSVLLVLALVLSAAIVLANEQTATAAEVAEQELQQLQNPFPEVPQAAEDETEAEESEGQDEGEASELSLAELSAETKANEEAVAKAMSATETESDLAADVAAATQAVEEGPLGRRRNTGKPKRRPLIAPMPIMKPVKFHSERIEAQSATNRNEDPEMAKLNLALAAVKEDILSTNKQITDERKWVIAVAKIIASYNDKMKRVEAHIIALRKEMKALYRKKKQIENLKLQKALEAKLKEARDELSVLTNSLKHVAVKQGQLNKSGMDLRQTIAGIQAQLAKLRGQQLRQPRPAARGGRKGRRGGRKGRRGGRKGKGKGKGCRKGFRFSRKAKRCVKKGRKAGRR